jgi:hypothetical protein
MMGEREPMRQTDPELAEVLAELMEREPIFHRREMGTARADFEKMTASEFWQVGASGRRYSREFVLDELESDMWCPVRMCGRPRIFVASGWRRICIC